MTAKIKYIFLNNTHELI